MARVLCWLWPVFTLLCLHLAAGQVLRFGHCPEFSALRNFEIEKYLGRWYQIERYFSFPGIGGKCWTQTYYADEEVPGRYKLKMDYSDYVMQRRWSTDMDIYQDIPEDPATLTSQLYGMPSTASEYQILSTDYDNYAIEWRCEERGLRQRRESLWILTRVPQPEEWVMNEARNVVESLGLRMSSLRSVSQSCHTPARNRVQQNKKSGQAT